MSELFCSTQEALDEIAAGRMLIVVDDEDRENEGDFLMSASFITPEQINFMATVGRGLICAPCTQERAEHLDLRPMVGDNTATYQTAFTVSIDASEGIETGISASDRARTLRLMASHKAQATDFVRPGHIFPLIAKEQGVLERNGHTEACVDLVHFSHGGEVGVICEICREDGEMARLPDLEKIAAQYNLKLYSIHQLVEYRKQVRRFYPRPDQSQPGDVHAPN